MSLLRSGLENLRKTRVRRCIVKRLVWGKGKDE